MTAFSPNDLHHPSGRVSLGAVKRTSAAVRALLGDLGGDSPAYRSLLIGQRWRAIGRSVEVADVRENVLYDLANPVTGDQVLGVMPTIGLAQPGDPLKIIPAPVGSTVILFPELDDEGEITPDWWAMKERPLIEACEEAAAVVDALKSPTTQRIEALEARLRRLERTA